VLALCVPVMQDTTTNYYYYDCYHHHHYYYYCYLNTLVVDSVTVKLATGILPLWTEATHGGFPT